MIDREGEKYKSHLVIHLEGMTKAEMDEAEIPEEERPGAEDIDEEYFEVYYDKGLVFLSESTLDSLIHMIPHVRDFTIVPADTGGD